MLALFGLIVIVLACDRAKFVEFGKDLPRAICGVLNALDAHIFVFCLFWVGEVLGGGEISTLIGELCSLSKKLFHITER